MPGGSPSAAVHCSTMAAKQELVDKSFRKHSQNDFECIHCGMWEEDLLEHTDEDLTWEQLSD